MLLNSGQSLRGRFIGDMPAFIALPLITDNKSTKTAGCACLSVLPLKAGFTGVFVRGGFGKFLFKRVNPFFKFADTIFHKHIPFAYIKDFTEHFSCLSFIVSQKHHKRNLRGLQAKRAACTPLVKKCLTNTSGRVFNRGRAENSDTSGYTAPIDFAGFFISADLVGSAANILNKRACLVSRFQLPTPYGLRKSSEKGIQDMKNQISIYNFNHNQIRTTTIDGEPWFALIDCANALGIKNAATSVKLSEAGVGKTYYSYSSGAKEITIINEPNLYRLIFRSNKPQAQAFADWVYAEVLPSIRKTGGYGAPALPDMKALGGVMKNCAATAFRSEFEKAVTDLIYTEKFKTIIREAVREELQLDPAQWPRQDWYVTAHHAIDEIYRQYTGLRNGVKQLAETDYTNRDIKK